MKGICGVFRGLMETSRLGGERGEELCPVGHSAASSSGLQSPRHRIQGFPPPRGMELRDAGFAVGQVGFECFLSSLQLESHFIVYHLVLAQSVAVQALRVQWTKASTNAQCWCASCWAPSFCSAAHSGFHASLGSRAKSPCLLLHRCWSGPLIGMESEQFILPGVW